jgi:putative transposase
MADMGEGMANGGKQRGTAGVGRKPAAKRSRLGRRPQQGELPFVARGGVRPGAGRKRVAKEQMVDHRTRSKHTAAHPVLVTVKLREHLPALRQKAERQTLWTHFSRGKDRFGFRLLHFAILNDHLHFLVEARDRDALTRGLQGLLIRVARGLNKLWGRKGKVFRDRYHDSELTTPRAVRNALVYVLGNGRKHRAEGRAIAAFDGPDRFTSAPWFDGFVESITIRGLDRCPLPVVVPRTWLAGVGWRKHGRIGCEEMPRSAG